MSEGRREELESESESERGAGLKFQISESERGAERVLGLRLEISDLRVRVRGRELQEID